MPFCGIPPTLLLANVESVRCDRRCARRRSAMREAFFSSVAFFVMVFDNLLDVGHDRIELRGLGQDFASKLLKVFSLSSEFGGCSPESRQHLPCSRNQQRVVDRNDRHYLVGEVCSWVSPATPARRHKPVLLFVVGLKLFEQREASRAFSFSRRDCGCAENCERGKHDRTCSFFQPGKMHCVGRIIRQKTAHGLSDCRRWGAAALRPYKRRAERLLRTREVGFAVRPARSPDFNVVRYW